MKIRFGKAVLLASTLLFSVVGISCGSDDNDVVKPTIPSEKEPDKDTDKDSDKTYDMTGFAKGADVSWLTEMEKDGVKFYTKDGKEQECMSLLRDLGTNSIRLRVWVNPDGGWCGKDDVVAKALR